jgi:hypothetical protein
MSDQSAPIIFALGREYVTIGGSELADDRIGLVRLECKLATCRQLGDAQHRPRLGSRPSIHYLAIATHYELYVAVW